MNRCRFRLVLGRVPSKIVLDWMRYPGAHFAGETPVVRVIMRRHFSGLFHLGLFHKSGITQIQPAPFFPGGSFMKELRLGLSILFLGFLAVSAITCAGDLALNSIGISPDNPSIPAGTTLQFTATGYLNDQTSQDITTEVTWSSSNTSVATINSSGLATAMAAGITTITATSTMPSSYSDEGSFETTTLTVNLATLSSISVTSDNPSIPVGGTQHFIATGTYSDGTSYDITMQVTWSSSDTSVATVSSDGLATAIAAGTTTITATSGSISGSTTLTVTPS